MDWYKTLFQTNKPLNNYKYVLELILLQMESESDWDRGYEHQGYIIQHYLDNLEESYREKIFDLIPHDILKEKILDVPYGFGTAFQEVSTSKEDEALFYKYRDIINDTLSMEEMEYYKSLTGAGCRKCGCSAEKDAEGERICFCDTCCKDGCDIIQ